jgi:hypothetical protein
MKGNAEIFTTNIDVQFEPARGTNKAVQARSKASATVRAVLGNP